MMNDEKTERQEAAVIQKSALCIHHSSFLLLPLPFLFRSMFNVGCSMFDVSLLSFFRLSILL